MIDTLSTCLSRRAAAMLAIGLLAAIGSQTARADALFVSGSTFQVQGVNSPDSFTNNVTFAPGSTALDGGALNLTFSIVPAAGSAEWLVFNYSTASGGPLSQPGLNWAINQVGLNAAVPVNFISSFIEFTSNGTALTPTSSIFGGTIEADPVSGGSGIGVGASFTDPIDAGPIGALGAFVNPFGFLGDEGIDPTQITGFYQALEFEPQNPTVPEPATVLLFGVGLTGLALLRRRALPGMPRLA